MNEKTKPRRSLPEVLDELYDCLNDSRPATRRDLRDAEQRLANLIISGKCRKRVHFDWEVGPVSQKPSTDAPSMDLPKLTTEQKIKVTLTPKTDAGKPAKLDGKPTWEVIAGESTVNVAEDGLSAEIVSADEPGDTQVLVKADADIGEGIEEISEILKVSVVGASAKNLGITVGTPELKEPATPTPGA